MAHSAEDRNIVSTIISLVHSLNLKVVAEGVETEEQRNLLQRLQCDEMNGTREAQRQSRRRLVSGLP